MLGAGGAAAIGFCRSLRDAGGYRLVGADSGEWGRYTHVCDELVDAESLIDAAEHVDFVHAQPDDEVMRLSWFRDGIAARTLLPSHAAVMTCRDKWLTWQRIVNHSPMTAGVSVPVTALYDTDNFTGQVWTRPRAGAGGKGGVLHEDGRSAQAYLTEHGLWGKHTIAEYLPGDTVTVTCLYRGGQLVASQGRERVAWTSGDRGSALVSRTVKDREADLMAYRAVQAIDRVPNGVYGVDMTRRANGQPCVTEINAGRFFTTVEFFTRCGLNLPDLYVKAGLGTLDIVRPILNPIEPGRLWVRSYDREPVLV